MEQEIRLSPIDDDLTCFAKIILNDLYSVTEDVVGVDDDQALIYLKQRCRIIAAYVKGFLDGYNTKAPIPEKD